jgi:hypothetical protein
MAGSSTETGVKVVKIEPERPLVGDDLTHRRREVDPLRTSRKPAGPFWAPELLASKAIVFSKRSDAEAFLAKLLGILKSLSKPNWEMSHGGE